MQDYIKYIIVFVISFVIAFAVLYKLSASGNDAAVDESKEARTQDQTQVSEEQAAAMQGESTAETNNDASTTNEESTTDTTEPASTESTAETDESDNIAAQDIDFPQLNIITLAEGSGEEAKVGDTVTVHYRGTLKDGTEFDTSYGREPFTFTLGEGRVIAGWEQGIPGMKVGEKRKLEIPSALAYGPQGRPPVIPPNAGLIFEVELLAVQAQNQ